MMKRLFIEPNTYSIYNFQKGDNPYIGDTEVNMEKAYRQYKAMIDVFQKPIVFSIPKSEPLSDIVFAASAGVCLPRLPHTLVVLPSMKYIHRKHELPYIQAIFQKLKLETVEFPVDAHAPFEGQAEIKWFCGGKKAICGYGHRSTKKTFVIMNKLLRDIYTSYDLEPPELLVVHLKSDRFYHLDLAMLEFGDTQCILHKDAFSNDTLHNIQQFLGKDNVHCINTKDDFCLNSVIDGSNIITHRLSDKKIKHVLETLTKKTVVEIDVSEFELSGGSIRCMSMNIF